MSYATTAVQKTLYFVPESANPPVSNRDNKPTFDSTHLLGTISTATLRNTRDVVYHETAQNGVWVKSAAFPQRDDQLLEVTLTELSEVAWEVILGDKVTLTSGSGPVVPGQVLLHNGWSFFQLVRYDGQDQLQIDLWSHLEVEEFTMPETGILTVTLKITKLWSSLNSGQLSNIV